MGEQELWGGGRGEHGKQSGTGSGRWGAAASRPGRVLSRAVCARGRGPASAGAPGLEFDLVATVYCLLFFFFLPNVFAWYTSSRFHISPLAHPLWVNCARKSFFASYQA